MNSKDIEELVATIRQYIQKARSSNDTFEYCRLCEELRLAQAALDECGQHHPATPAKSSTILYPLALA